MWDLKVFDFTEVEEKKKKQPKITDYQGLWRAGRRERQTPSYKEMGDRILVFFCTVEKL